MDAVLDRSEAALCRLVGSWEGTLRHRSAGDQPFRDCPAVSENRWVLDGKFVEMSLRCRGTGEHWSAVFYIGFEERDRRYVIVSVEPGDPRVTVRRGEWVPDSDRLMLLGEPGRSGDARIVCDLRRPGQLKVEFAGEGARGEAFVRFAADYRPAPVAPARSALADKRRFVIA